MSSFEYEEDTFDAVRWAESKFESTSYHLVKTLAGDLQKERSAASKSLEQNVAENYNNIVQTSREIGALELDMATVRSLLIQLNSTLRTQVNTKEFGDSLAALEASRLEQQELGSLSAGADSASGPGTTTTAAAMESATSVAIGAQDTNSLLGQLRAHLRWLVGLPDHLDVLLVDRRFDDAVSQVQRARRLLDESPAVAEILASHGVQRRLDEHGVLLKRLLRQTLENAAAKRVETRRAIACMCRLGAGDVAKDVFLDTRSQRIAVDSRRVLFRGSVSRHVAELAGVVFAAVEGTCDDFAHAFGCHPDNADPSPVHSSTTTAPPSTGSSGSDVGRRRLVDLSSSLLVWTARELSLFADQVARQALGTDDFNLTGHCLALIQAHCTRLSERGIYLDHHLRARLLPPVRAAVTRVAASMQTGLMKALADETWVFTAHHQYDDGDKAGAHGGASDAWVSTASAPGTGTGTGSVGAAAAVDPSPTQANGHGPVKTTASAKFLRHAVLRFLANTASVASRDLSPTIADVIDGLVGTYVEQVRGAWEALSAEQKTAATASVADVTRNLVPECRCLFEEATGHVPVAAFRALQLKFQEEVLS